MRHSDGSRDRSRDRRDRRGRRGRSRSVASRRRGDRRERRQRDRSRRSPRRRPSPSEKDRSRKSPARSLSPAVGSRLAKAGVDPMALLEAACEIENNVEAPPKPAMPSLHEALSGFEAAAAAAPSERPQVQIEEAPRITRVETVSIPLLAKKDTRPDTSSSSTPSSSLSPSPLRRGLHFDADLNEEPGLGPLERFLLRGGEILENITIQQWLGQEDQAVPCFLLVVSKPDPELLLRYEALAMELMEFQNFHLAVDNGGEKWKDLPGTRPSIHFIANKELHLEAPPFELAFDQDLMRPWVIISSLPTVRHQINFYMWELIPIGWSVVVLRHHGDHDAVERFQERTKAMREALRYSFVHLDVSTESGNGFAMTFFPLIAAYWEDYIPYFTDVQDPRIFVFTKTHADGTLYWDSHYIDFPSPDDFQLEDVDQLMRKSPALDPIDFAEWPHWFLRYERFGGRSSVHRAIWLCAPFVSFYLFLYFGLWFFFFVRAIQESGLFSLFSLSGKASQAAPERVKKPKKGKKNR